jgi:virginiamycin B lyase
MYQWLSSDPPFLPVYNIARSVLILLVLLLGGWASGLTSVRAQSIPQQHEQQQEQQTEQIASPSLVPAKTQHYLSEFPVQVAPLNVAVEAVGRIWFTAPDQNVIGSLVVTSTSDFISKTYPLPTANSRPYDLIYTQDAIWFSEQAGNKLGKLTISSGVIQEFTLPTANSEPKGLTQTPDGNIWYVGSKGNQLGRFNPQQNTFQEFVYPTPNAQFEKLGSDDLGHLWFTSPTLGRAIFYDPMRAQFQDVYTTPEEKPLGLVVDAGRQPWILCQDTNIIGRYSPGTLTLWRWFRIPTLASKPAGMAVSTAASVGNNLAVWYTQQASGRVGLLLLDSDRIEILHMDQALPSANGQPWGVVADAQGNAWIAAPGTRSIVQWAAPYFYTIHLPVISYPNK